MRYDSRVISLMESHYCISMWWKRHSFLLSFLHCISTLLSSSVLFTVLHYCVLLFLNCLLHSVSKYRGLDTSQARTTHVAITSLWQKEDWNGFCVIKVDNLNLEAFVTYVPVDVDKRREKWLASLILRWAVNRDVHTITLPIRGWALMWSRTRMIKSAGK